MRRSENPEPSVGFCAVCGDRADGYHYGVLSCRGCNAFFRRAIAFNLQFHCRREGRCEINKNARCACRECRLKKCRDVGMDPSAVQVKREMKDVLALHQHHSHHQRRNVDADLSEPSISSILSAHVYGSAKVLDSPTLKSRLLGSMSSSMAHSPQVMHPIDRLVEWYFCQYYRRMSMLCQTVEQILGAMNGQQEKLIAPATPEELIQVNKVQMVLMFEWVEQLEEFEQLEDPMEKTQLLRAFASKYLLLDTVMHTLEQGFTDRIVLPNGSYIHRNETPFLHSTISFDYGSNEEERRRHRAMEMLYEEDHLGLIEELIQPLADFEVTFSEFMALRLLLFWDSQELRNEPVQAHLAEIIRHSSDRTVGDLQSWYEQQIPAVSEHGRLDNLLLFLPTIKKFSNHLSKITALIPDFSVMSEWQFIGDLVIGNSRS